MSKLYHDSCRCRHSSRQLRKPRGRRPFVIHGAKAHYAPDRPFKLLHTLLDLTLDPRQSLMRGQVIHSLQRLSPNALHVELDQINLEIQQVSLNDQVVPFTLDHHRLIVQVPLALEKFDLRVTYEARRAMRGIFFTGPDQYYPRKPYQVWTQGQDEDSRWWFPSFDHPSQKSTVEILATVPEGFTAVANGKLIETKAAQHPAILKGRQFHYRLASPIPCYLISLCVGEFDFWEDLGPRGIPVQYFVAKGRKAEGQRSFGHTPKMMEVFERLTGMPYPYEKYAQVAVQDFIFGGMENASATTQTDDTLHDERAALDFTSDPLVSHELAHQWFGDLVTCRDWSHGWLNEGFATFMERVWIENDTGRFGGKDEADYSSYVDLNAYFADDEESYRRPIVCNTFIRPSDIFDTHLYQKGGLVLNLLRKELGEDTFWKAIQHYLQKHAHQSVETHDLIRAIEETSGRNLRRFFDDWVYGAGYPELEVTFLWDENLKRVDLTIEQKQTQGKSHIVEDGFKTHLFALEMDLVFVLADGQSRRHRMPLHQARERLLLDLPSQPQMICFDPGNSIPKTLKVDLPEDMLITQLLKGQDMMGRIFAAQSLVDKPEKASKKVIDALQQAVLKDPFWGVGAEAAKSLSHIRLDTARDALIQCLGVPNPRLRRAVVEALGKFKDHVSSQALLPISQADPSYLVEAAATTAWAQSLRSPDFLLSAQSSDQAEAHLIEQLKKDSHVESIRKAALAALAQLPGVGSDQSLVVQEKSRRPALQTLVEWTKKGRPMRARYGAIVALGSLVPWASQRVVDMIFEIFEELADENQFMVRWALTIALEQSDSLHAIPILQKLRRIDSDGRIQRDSQEIIERLRETGSSSHVLSKLQHQLTQLEDDYRKLKNEVEGLRRSSAPASHSAE